MCSVRSIKRYLYIPIMFLYSIPLIIISRFNDAHIGFRLLHNITNMILIVKIIPKSGRCDFSHIHIIPIQIRKKHRLVLR